MLEKNSLIPIYIQLKNILKGAIMSGEIGQNEMIPSETQLAETYGITRTTVRRAIAELVNEGFLRKEHGKGTFVILKPVSYSVWNFSSFTDYVQKKGKIPTSKTLTAEITQMDDKPYFKLERARGIKEDGKILYLTVDTSHIPLDLFPGINKYDFEKRSLYDVMRKEYGIRPSTVEIIIKPHIMDERIACVFGISENAPLLRIQGQVSDAENRVVELTQVIYSPRMDLRLVTRISTL